MQNKVMLYTAIFGDKDDAPIIHNPEKIDLSHIDFYCITDNPELRSIDYKMQVVSRRFSDVTKNARYFKICGAPELSGYDVAIWHDSSVIIHASQIEKLISFSAKFSLATFKHGHICIYPEARQCIEMGKDSPLRIALQVIYYGFILKYPRKNGVYETTMLVKNLHEYDGSELQKTWWKHVRWFSRRDQLSLPVAKWLSNQEIGILEGKGFDNPYSTYRGHRYYHYITGNPLWKLNSAWLKKIGVWVTYKVEHYLSKKGLVRQT